MAFVLRLRKFEMIQFSLQRSISLAYAGLLVTSAFSAVALADDAEAVIRVKAEPAGVVHVSNSTTAEVTRGQSPRRMARRANGEYYETQNCPPQQTDCPDCPESTFSWHDCPGKSAFDGWLMGQCASHRMRSHYQTTALHSNLQANCRETTAWARCKFGYFIPSGSCGQGTPLVGHYSMVYPVNPQHFDGRDGQVYAANGYAGPVAIPIAPNVNQTYNYGWGVPSSRLTPISHPVSPAQVQAYRNSQVPGMPVQY